ncbi:DUF4118 domain-containing protein [Rubellimicrobium arenae]|uniref:DUF4118 domain-containing protein n=1 Tax=Rubellimicrobium arenae TaxID=2817372 RepID=UPI001B312092|nr:DUF4118 domain-containing protein [Rubellimicrobium arenae]
MRYRPPVLFDIRAYAETLIAVSLVTAGALIAGTVLSSDSADLLYLLPVLVAASLHGLGSGLFAAVLGALAYNFFFTVPLHTFRISRSGDLITVLVLLAVALVTGHLTAQLRRRARDAAARAERDASLAAFARVLVGPLGDEALGHGICSETGRLMDANAVLVVPDDGRSRLLSSEPHMDELDAFAAEAAEEAMSRRATTGRGSSIVAGSDWTFHPLATSDRVVGALGFARDDGRPPVEPGREPLLATLLDQAALALERQRLAREVAEVARLREQDRLRRALLSSVSHDLRTPLTSIVATAAELRRDGRSDPAAVGLLEDEARRLDRYVSNLLDMVRLEAGALRLRLEPVDLPDAVAAVERDLGRVRGAGRLRGEVPADLPLVRLDPQLLHHCLLNLADNALRHGGTGPVTIRAEQIQDGLVLEILDSGPGLRLGQEGRIFDSFVRLDGSDRQGGTGLGLAIVKGFAEAMGLSVVAGNRPQGGAAFVLRIPARLLIDDLRAEAG